MTQRIRTEGGQATGMAIDNVLTGGTFWPGVSALGAGATMRASGNTVTRFPLCGFQAQLGSTFESTGDNVLRRSDVWTHQPCRQILVMVG